MRIFRYISLLSINVNIAKDSGKLSRTPISCSAACYGFKGGAVTGEYWGFADNIGIAWMRKTRQIPGQITGGNLSIFMGVIIWLNN